MQILLRMEQEQKVTEDARIAAERDAAEQKYAAHLIQVNLGAAFKSCFLEVLFFVLLVQLILLGKVRCIRFHTLYMQEKYEAVLIALSQMEKRAVMAETMLEATKQYQAGQVKAIQTFAPKYVLVT